MAICGEMAYRELAQAGGSQQAYTARIFMAYFAPVALIIPVAIMVLLGANSYGNLGVVILFIGLFAIVFALGASDSTSKDIFAATAAYTAVLVVFLAASQ